MNRLLPPDKIPQILRKLEENNIEYSFEEEKLRINFNDSEGKPLFLRLPLNYQYPEKLNFIILLIQSGSCAMGYFENDKNLDHKVFKSYMVRMKQGFSQVKYLKTKGKSRSGSRVRLGETAEFFENINNRLQEYFNTYRVEKIALSCPKILIPFLYGSKIPSPFTKDDQRIYKIPKHIHTPGYEVLQNTHKYLLSGEIVFTEEQAEFVKALFI